MDNTHQSVRRLAALAVGLVVAGTGIGPLVAATPELAQLLKRPDFGDIKISPNGDYFAATVDNGDSTDLVVLRRDNNTTVGGIQGGQATGDVHHHRRTPGPGESER